MSLLLVSLFACSTSNEGDTSSDSATDDDNHEECPVPSDGYTADAISAGGAGVVCYYAPPEGYCRDIHSAATASAVEGGDKAAIGCADAIVVTDGACPTDLALGRCVGWSAEEDRVYYECNKFDEIYPDGLQAGCETGGGTWVPA